MRITEIEITNFRLLAHVSVGLDEGTTVIVGRNNSGKTSLTELFRRLLDDTAPTFKLEDFSLSCHDEFWKAFEAHQDGQEEPEVRALLPVITLNLTFEYDPAQPVFGPLADFIINLEPTCTTAIAAVRYELREGGISALFADLPTIQDELPEAQQKQQFCRAIRERIPKLYSATLAAVDPLEPGNTKTLEWSSLRGVVGSGFITAQRGLDDITHKERDVLGKVLEALLETARMETSDPADRGIVAGLEGAVADIQTQLDAGFNEQLRNLLPAFSLFGYPGLAEPGLGTETVLDVRRLLTNHTKVHYAGINGINLPEAYNGLGARNLIYILLKLLEFFKKFMADTAAPGVHLIFIEEPEVHLHPQMQEVFIRKLREIVASFNQTYNTGRGWPVQFVVTTHSAHVANKAPFDALRYFLVKAAPAPSPFRHTEIKDLKTGLAGEPEEVLDFLHKYMTLTRCDLLFADKAVLIEGTAERLLFPTMITKIEAEHPNEPRLSSQYVSIVEVGGAYAHLFFPLVEFLELPTLVVTDLDSTQLSSTNRWESCRVSQGQRTSNACIKSWFERPEISPVELIAMGAAEKCDGSVRIAYQIPEQTQAPCGRSFEDAFILANHAIFDLPRADEETAWEEAKVEGKSDFALKLVIENEDWVVPLYISEGLRWLAAYNAPLPPPPETPVQNGSCLSPASTEAPE